MWIICQLTIISFWLEKFTYKKQHGYKLYVGGRSILVDKATSIWYRTKTFSILHSFYTIFGHDRMILDFRRWLWFEFHLSLLNFKRCMIVWLQTVVDAAQQTSKVIEGAKPIATSTVETISSTDPAVIAVAGGTLFLAYLLLPPVFSALSFSFRGYKGNWMGFISLVYFP